MCYGVLLLLPYIYIYIYKHMQKKILKSISQVTAIFFAQRYSITSLCNALLLAVFFHAI